MEPANVASSAEYRNQITREPPILIGPLGSTCMNPTGPRFCRVMKPSSAICFMVFA